MAVVQVANIPEPRTADDVDAIKNDLFE
jgi:hypothetical protein